MRFLLGGVFILLRDVMRTFCIFSFLYFLDTLFLFYWSCDHLVIANLVFIWYIYIYIFDEVVITFFHLSLHVLYLFFLSAHASYLLYAIFYFCFTLRMLWWVLFKVFQKYKLSKSSMPWTLFLQIFSRVCARIFS